MKKIKLIALFGPGGCGKSTLLNYITDNIPTLNKIISYTTRPPRQGEKNGVDYHFVSIEEFGERLLKGDIIEATSWNDQFYGTSYSSLDQDKVNIKILDIDGIEILREDSRIDLYPIYIACEDKTCIKRMLDRVTSPNCPAICAKYLEDLKKFNVDIDFEHGIFYNGEGIPLRNFYTYISSLDFLTKID